MEAPRLGPEMDPPSDSDFYESVIGRSLTEEELDSHFNSIEVENLEDALLRVRGHPEAEVLGDKTLITGYLMAVIKDPYNNYLILREDTYRDKL
jgi:hypothetical protein